MWTASSDFAHSYFFLQILYVRYQGLILYCSNDIELPKRINTIAFTLIDGNCNEHSLRAKLTPMGISVYGLVDPFQASAQKVMDGYNSATIVGDADNAMVCAVMYCIASFCCFAGF